MATSVTLADLQAAAQERWGDYVIEDLGVTLRHALRLSKKERAALAELQGSEDEDEDDGEDDEDVVDRIEKTITLLAATPAQGEKLLEAVGGDATILIALMEQYQEATQLGEASDSEN